MNLLLLCTLLNISLSTAVAFLKNRGHSNVSMSSKLPTDIIADLKREFDTTNSFEQKRIALDNEVDYYNRESVESITKPPLAASAESKNRKAKNFLAKNYLILSNAVYGIAGIVKDICKTIQPKQDIYYCKDQSDIVYLCNSTSSKISFINESVKTTFLRTLAEQTKEQWGSIEHPYEILENYLSNTYIQLEKDNMLVRSKKKQDKILFNSGLIDNKSNGKYIYIIGKEYAHGGIGNLKMVEISELPDHGTSRDTLKVADFGEQIRINASWQINVDDSDWFHITQERIERISDVRECKYKGLNEIELERLFRATVCDELPIKNSNIPFYPFYYKGSLSQQKIQYLMPIYLDTADINQDTTPSCVLILEPNNEKKILKPRTILTPYMAYMNARLLCRNKNECPSESWLKPSTMYQNVQ